ncbi:hypothetical protein C4G41_RS22320 [Vibrio parahaemolyticus]|uniref:hypothetical protein n=1 Tax=Vibrio TaxID=662 RepID=UPI001D16DCB7|nr:hypothetical protein [Vibrio parahaemolyticus]EGQ9118300.1 hypothetical protein [Vibrio parahaemolyticus]EJG0725779.1 hypothetical protein [Vibrio parahaemolyticus]EJG0800472.1 hypothetical protein [Vibrio parahaemolyticus]MCC3788898.1 hypothetical protein [Vibrio parahaemolyticus]MCC3836552.1 hypothetical protein [Vibrio parahaemolyticus]
MILDIIPLSVFVALVLFCIREVRDFVKGRNENKRKLDTLKVLLSEELRENYSTLKSLFRVAEQVLLTFDTELPIQKHVNTDRYGNDYIYIHIGEPEDNENYSLVAMPLAHLETKQYENHIHDVALLNKELYDSVNELYVKLRRCEKIRNTLVCHIAGEINDVRNWALSTNVKDIVRDQVKYLEKLDDVHHELTSKRLEEKFGSVAQI